MIKTTLMTAAVGLLALTSSIAAQAQTRPAPGEPTSLSGLYFGGYGGYGWGDTDTPFGDGKNVDGWDYGVYGGYTLDTLLDRTIGMGINGSIEGHWGWSSADDNTRFAGQDAGVRKEHEWGVDFRPGLSFVDNALDPWGVKPYGILGYRQTDYKAHAFGFSTDKDYSGFALGAGAELLTYGNFGVRADYTHVFYGKRDGIDPAEDDVRVGIAYHFK